MDGNALCAHDACLLAGLPNRGAELVAEIVPRHSQQIEARRTGRRFEKAARSAAELHDLQVVVDNHAGRRVAPEHDLIGRALHLVHRLRSWRRSCR